MKTVITLFAYLVVLLIGIRIFNTFEPYTGIAFVVVGLYLVFRLTKKWFVRSEWEDMYDEEEQD